MGMKHIRPLLFILSGMLLASCASTPAAVSSSKETLESTQDSHQTSSVSVEESTLEPSSEPSVSTSEQSNPTSEPSQPSSSASQESTSQASSEAPFAPPAGLKIADGPILHCFNWSMNNVKNNLAAIKAAGYRAVQISPMQPQKDPYSGNWKNEWWKLYQPLGFHVAVNNENVLGTKSDLIAMCAEAKKKGIRVVADIVANHLANGGSSDHPSLYGPVANHEPDIYNNQSQTVHDVNIGGANDNDLKRTVWGHIGLPDLNTANKTVQNRVISLLKEYIDCGVTGFRFDAAKHIETPSDGDYASDFWPTVLGAATNYSKTKNNEEPFYYGEILYRPGGNRSWDVYTSFMSVCDNTNGSDVIHAVVDKNIGAVPEGFASGVNADHLVLWAESHDTYSNDSGYDITRNYSEDDINKAYVIQTSRKDAGSLYLARSSGSMGEVTSTGFKNNAVGAINKFHTLFVGRSEKISKNDGTFVNVRGSGKECGAAIVNLSNASSVSLNLGLAAGQYTDLVNGSTINVGSGKTNVTLHGGCAVLVPSDAVIDPPEGSGPTITMNAAKRVFSGSTSVSISVKNATSASYTINGQTTSFSGSTIVTVNPSSNGKVELTVTAKNAGGTSTQTLVLYKVNSSVLSSTIIVIDIPSDLTVFPWVWATGQNGRWATANATFNGLASFTFSEENFLLASFAAGTTKPDWTTKKGQTRDMKVGDQIIDYDDLAI